jgi:hypothetical protein
MAENDLTKRMSPFFDLHLIIPLLEFVEPREVTLFALKLLPHSWTLRRKLL